MTNMVLEKPITPQEVKEIKLKSIPQEVIKAFNNLIIKKWSWSIRSSIIIKQNEIIDEIIKEFVKSSTKVTRAQIFENSWLDVEDLFRQSGWDVTYDKPAYCENYEPYFEFINK